MASTSTSFSSSLNSIPVPTNAPSRTQIDWSNSNGKEKRQEPDNIAPSNVGYPDCSFVGNGVLSCYPEANSTLVQHEYSKFVWNSRYPVFIGSNLVDVYLYGAGPEELQLSWKGLENSRGSLGLYPDDTFFPIQTSFAGQNITRNYFFIIVPHNQALSGGQTHQATFAIVQTAAPQTLIASLASVSSVSAASASSLSSLSSVSSASAASVASLLSELGRATITLSPTGTSPLPSSTNSMANSNPGLRPDTVGSTNLPKWAVAIIVVLSILAGLFILLGLYFWIRRKRRQVKNVNSDSVGIIGVGGGGERNRDSDLIEQGTLAEKLPLFKEGGLSGSEEGPITSTEATTMAEAFRAALRQPDFQSSEEPSPGEEDGIGKDERGKVFLERELASAGLVVSASSNSGKTWGDSAESG